MKKLALILCILLLLTGCSVPAGPGGSEEGGTLPALSDGETVTPTDGQKPTPSGNNPNRPTLPHSEDEETTPVSIEDAIVVVSEVSGRSRQRQDTGKSWSFQLPADGTFTFGETVPLSLSAEAAQDGTVTVRFPSGGCYVQSGTLEKKADAVSLTFADTVYVTVREGGKEAHYSIRLEQGE